MLYLKSFYIQIVTVLCCIAFLCLYICLCHKYFCMCYVFTINYTAVYYTTLAGCSCEFHVNKFYTLTEHLLMKSLHKCMRIVSFNLSLFLNLDKARQK